MVHKEKKKGIVFILNNTEVKLNGVYALEKLGIPSDWHVFRFRTGEKEELWKKQLVVTIPSHDCRLYLVSEEDQITPDYERLWNNLQ